MINFHKGTMITNFYPALFILNLLLFTHSSAADQSFPGTQQDIPVIRLRVTLDVSNHRVYGQAEIKLPEDKQEKIKDILEQANKEVDKVLDKNPNL